MAPKQSSERAWWNACRKVFQDLPTWSEVRGAIKIDVTYETLHFSWAGHDIFVARRRDMT